MADVKVNQIYAELGGKKRYLKVKKIAEDVAVCLAGWRTRGNQVSWSNREPILLLSSLTDQSMYRLEQDADE